MSLSKYISVCFASLLETQSALNIRPEPSPDFLCKNIFYCVHKEEEDEDEGEDICSTHIFREINSLLHLTYFLDD